MYLCVCVCVCVCVLVCVTVSVTSALSKYVSGWMNGSCVTAECVSEYEWGWMGECTNLLVS